MANKKPVVGTVPNALEAVKELGSGVKTTLKKDVAEGFTANFMEQLLNFSLTGSSTTENTAESPSEQTAKPGKSGEIVNFSHVRKTEAKKPVRAEARAEAHIDYHRDIVKGSERATKTEVREMDKNMQEILAELTRLISSSKMLQMEFATVVTEQKPVNIGKYHVNFFEWMLIMVRQARQRVEDSGAWLQGVKGKNSKAKWDQMSGNRKNTSVTLSNERQVASSVG